MAENTQNTLDFNALLADLKNNGTSMAEATHNIQKTQRRILNELEFNKQFYLDYVDIIVPNDCFSEEDFHDLMQDTVLRAIHNADAIPNDEDSIRLYLMSEMLACLEERQPGPHIDPHFDSDDIVDESTTSSEKTAHLSRIRNALRNVEKILQPHERILMHAMLENMLGPDNIPQALLNRLDLEREDVLEILHNLLEKLSNNKRLRNLHDDRDPDGFHPP